MIKDKYIIKELNAKIKIREHYKDVSIKKDYAAGVEYDSGYIEGLKFAIHLIEDCKLPYVDENAETLEDKLRVEHMPIPEEREDASLFETLSNKFRPKYE